MGSSSSKFFTRLEFLFLPTCNSSQTIKCLSNRSYR
jgi:hypothetical protein